MASRPIYRLDHATLHDEQTDIPSWSRYFTWRADRYTVLITSRSMLLEWQMCQTKVVEEITTHILFFITCSRKWCVLWDNVGKCIRAGQAKDHDILRCRKMGLAGGWLWQEYKHTFMIFNTVIPRLTMIIRSGITFVSRNFSLSRM